MAWIKTIVKAGLVVMVLWIFALIYYSFTREAWIYDPLKIIYSVLIYWLGYQGLLNSVIANRQTIKPGIDSGSDKSYLSKPFIKKIKKLKKFK